MPTVTLTPKSIRSLPAIDGRRTSYRDAVAPGLELRVSPSSARTYAVVYKRGGRQARVTLGPASGRSLKEAREEARRIRAEAALGHDPARAIAERRHAPERLTLAQVGERFMKEMARGHRLRPRTEGEYQRLLDREILPALGERPAGDVTRREVRETVRAIESRAPIVANRTFALIRRLYAWAVSEDLVVGSPCVGMSRPAPEEPTDRVLSAEELRGLQLALDEFDSASADVIRLLLLTGVRLGMVLGARRGEFHEIDEEHEATARWVIPGGYQGRSKNRRAHVVPLAPAVVKVVRRRLEAWAGELLFPNRDDHTKPLVWRTVFLNRVRRQLAVHVNAARAQRGQPPVVVPPWTVHQLRHTVRTHLREDLRVPDDVAELIVGHVRQGVVGTYNRAELLNERRTALVAWADWLNRMVFERPGARVLPMGRRPS